MAINRCQSKVLVHVYTKIRRKNLIAYAAVAGEPHVAEGGKVELQLLQADTGGVGGQWDEKILGPAPVIMRQTIHNVLPGVQAAAFPLKDHEGEYCLKAVFIDRYGHSWDTETIQSKLGLRPSWLGSREGIDNKSVPPPWTPLKTSGDRQHRAVHCWGRAYRFSPGALLEQVTAEGRALLAGPVAVHGSADNRKFFWENGTFQWRKHTAARSVISWKAETGNVIFLARAEVEYDGMVRIDWRLAARTPVVISSLVLEIPFLTEVAKSYSRYTSRALANDNYPTADTIPAKGMRMKYCPFIWLGDEERGMAWFAESEQNWYCDNPAQAIEVERKGKGKIILRLHLISRPVRITAGRPLRLFKSNPEMPCVNALDYSFGFQATPVKPVGRDAFDNRTILVLPGRAGASWNVPGKQLDRLVAFGVRTLIVFESWSDIESHFISTHKRQLKSLVRACHERGMQVLFYFGMLISESAPEWRDFGNACLTQPATGWPVYNYQGQPPQTAWRVCYRSSWQDFLVNAIAKTMDEYDIDGVYLDGTMAPRACSNVLHGCGLRRSDGSMTCTYPIFSVRSTMKRIYNVVKTRKPDGQVDAHNSACMTIPTLAWATSYWNGEHLAGIKKGTDLNKFLGLSAFRAEFMGHQWGVPAEFLCYAKPIAFRQAWAITLLHDVPVRTGDLYQKERLGLTSSIWKVFDAFGRKEAEWLPYWRNAAFVAAATDNVFISLYRHARNGVLAVISNLDKKEARVKVKFNLAKLGLPERVKATDALNERPLQISGGKAALKLPALDWILLLLKPVTRDNVRYP